MDDRGVDRLFSLPLGDFVAARNELAKALKAQGDKETAARILKLPKPSISAWAINQLVRQEPELIKELIDSLDRQRQLQVDGLSGGVDRDAFKEAKQSENEAIGKIERALPSILDPAGHASGRSTIERCVRSIRAAAVHAEGRPLLLNGHLTIDFDTPGFEALGELQVTVNLEDKRREKEDRLEQMRQQRIEAQQKIEEEQRRFAERAKQKPDPQRVKQTMFEEKVELPDLQRVKLTMVDPARKRPDPERAKPTMSEASDVEQAKSKARLGEAAKILATLRVDYAKLEEQSILLDDTRERARLAHERAERDAARAKEELAQKKAQIANLEQLLGLFDEEEE